MKTILVTGGNRGIGLEICRQLDRLGHTVILCSRVLEKGKEAAKLLSKNVIVKQLDVTNEESILKLYEFVKINYGQLDVLINNAGISEMHAVKINTRIQNTKSFLAKFETLRRIKKIAEVILCKTSLIPQKRGAQNTTLIEVKYIMETNFYGPWRMIQIFTPLLQKNKNGRIINMSSGMGELKKLTGYYPGYSLSKSSLNALTIMFSRELKDKCIKVNAMCPGWVKTEKEELNAPRNVSQGADTAVWLATESNIPTGKFFRDRMEINW